MFERIAIHGFTIGCLAVLGCGDAAREPDPAKLAGTGRALVAAGAAPTLPAAPAASPPSAATPSVDPVPAQSDAERAARTEVSNEDLSGLTPERRRAHREADTAARREALQIKRAFLAQAETNRRGRAPSEERDALDRQISNMRDNIGKAEEKLRTLEEQP